MEREKPARTAKAVFDRAHEISAPAERKAYLDQACANAPELRQKVEALLQAYEKAGSGFLEKPAVPPSDTGPYQPAKVTPASPGALPPTGDHEARTNYPVGAEGPGTQIGPYKLIEKLGEGGMGVVWLAEQVQPIRRQVALKIIKSGMDSAHVVARFEAERQALTLMDHVNIARVLDAGATDRGLPYFVMELVKGVPMTGFCKEHKLTIRERLMLFATVCQAIQHAHQKGVIHRDIKPSNVLVAMQEGKPAAKVIDFGLAKATEQPLTEHSVMTLFGNIVGTLAYMSPEQADFDNPGIDTRTDVYSLGVMLYELLTGTTPLDGARRPTDGLPEVLRKIKEEEPSRPSAWVAGLGKRLPKIATQRNTEPARLVKLLRGELDWITLKALEKDRNRRYETASGFASDVQRYLADEPVEACPPTTGYRLGKLVRKYRVALGVAAGFVAMLVLLVVGLAVSVVVVNAARERAENEKLKAVKAQEREEIEKLKAVKAKNETVKANNKLTTALRMSDSVIQVVAHNLPKVGRREKTTLSNLLHNYSRSLAEEGDTQEERFMAAESQFRLATSFKFIAERDKAATGYRRAIQLYQGLVDESPSVVEYRAELARSNFNLAITLHQLEKNQEAEELYRRAIHLHEQLATEFPAKAVYRRDLADDYNNLGALLRDRPELTKAEKACRQAIALGEKLVLEDPDHRVNLGASYHNLGNAVRDQGNPKAALAWYSKAIQLLGPIKPRPDDVRVILRNACWDRANSLGQLNLHAQASQDWQRALNLQHDERESVYLQLFLAASRMEEKLNGPTQPTGGLLYEAAVLHALATAAAGAADEVGLKKHYGKRTLALLNQAKTAGWFRDPLRIKQLKEDKNFAALPAADFKAFLESLEARKGPKDRPEKK